MNTNGIDNEIWIFLSHSNQDYEKVRRVRNILEDMNTRPLMFFLKCLSDNDEIEDLVKREIEARTRFILCDSINARKSNWVAKEIAYIEKKHKPYDIIDISASEQDIREELKNCFRKEHLFISYPRELLPAIKVVNERLSKYDFCTSFIDIFDTSAGIPFLDQFQHNIEMAISNGHFIPILSRHSLDQARLSQFELDLALENDVNHKSILPIYLDKESKSHFQNKLSQYESIDLSNRQTPHDGWPNSKDIPYRHGNIGTENELRILGDDIANAILVRLQGWGNIETYAENFRYARGLPQDIDEADRLAKLVVEHLEAVDCGPHFNGPGMLIRLGGLFEKGKVVQQNYATAVEYYREARNEYCIGIDYLLARIPEEFL